MKVEDFNYELPEELIAQTPLQKRDESRLMVLDKNTGEIEHKHFRDVLSYLHAGDTLVLNNTKVLPARLYGEKEDTKAAIEVLLLKNVKDQAILRAEGIPGRMQKHAVNFMTLIVLLEGREIFGDYYDRELKECIRRSLYEFADDSKKVPLEYVGTDGRPTYWKEGRLVDAGHTMESLWFSIYAGHEMGIEEYRVRAGEILDWVIDLCYDETYGGFIQNADMDGGKPEEEFCVTDYCGIPAAWDSKIWWVQAEGLNALFLSALYNENEKHFQYFKKLYEYTERQFRDRKYGEWFAILDREGNILCDRKGFELKGPYHIPRCLMEISLLAEKYIAAGRNQISERMVEQRTADNEREQK